jgi:glycosyltransferase involved in cell wall biosynthesis
MRILFIAFPNSIHTARWISQIADQGWDLRVFSSYYAKPHPLLRNLSLLGARISPQGKIDSSVNIIRWPEKYFLFDWALGQLGGRDHKIFRPRVLLHAIQEFRPDIIHSLEFQHAGYLTASAKKRYPGRFPQWIATNWGSDILLYRKIADHKNRIEEVLRLCDYYSCECERDILLAKEMGFEGRTLPVLPNAGGFKLSEMEQFRTPGVSSARKTIVIRGYQGWAGRALVALKALEECQELLLGYRIVIYSADRVVIDQADQISGRLGLTIAIMPHCSHEELLKIFGQARVFIGLSKSDGISTSMLEAITMGAFPIQSCTACADEWIIDGKSGFIVPPEDPHAVADMLRRALTDDALVDRAAEINSQTARERLDYGAIQKRVIQVYEDIYARREE